MCLTGELQKLAYIELQEMDRYEGLSTWKLKKNDNILIGEITLPMPIASAGSLSVQWQQSK